ncbi:MAG: FadR/GntR family transcriptional regulator, partial [Atribacterota bacterium]
MVTKKSKLIFQKIINDVKNGKYKAGDKLPSEDLFCKQYGASRSSVREALQALSLVGLISIRPGLGTFLEKITMDKLFNPANIFIEPDYDFLVNLLEFRKAFEKIILEMVINKRSNDDLQKLDQILELTKFYFERDEDEGFNKYDFKFHEELVKITKNKVNENILNIIYPYLRFAISKSARTKEDKRKTVQS